MVNCRCHYCGQPTDRPMIFTHMSQQVFNYIWDNPGCTKDDIEIALYGKIRKKNAVSMILSKIRTRLEGTGYYLRTRDIQIANRRRTYEISKPSTGELKANPHVPTDRPDCLS